MVSQIALRALHAVFGSDPYGLVSTVVFNGIVEAIDRSTGQKVEPCLITLRATRDQFAPLILREVDPVACVRKYFAADVSAHPDELQAVEPVMNFNMADPRIIDPVDVISGMDKRPNLLQLTPKEFESFVQNLFTRMGLDTKQYQASGDGGVDCVAYEEGATKGILITTSGFGPSSYEFANGKPLQLIDGTGLLALCRTHNVPARIAPISGSKKR